jgi:ankyrin repeat protein
MVSVLQGAFTRLLGVTPFGSFAWARRAFLASTSTAVVALLANCANIPNTGSPSSPAQTRTVSERDRINSLIDDPTKLVPELAGTLNANGKDPSASPLLVLAVKRQRLASFKVLLGAHADPNAPDAVGNNAWYYALIEPSDAYVNALTEDGAGPPAFTSMQLGAIGTKVIGRAQTDRLMILLHTSAATSDGALLAQLLHAALAAKNVNAVKALLALSVDASGLSFDELKSFTARGQESLLAQVLTRGASASAKKDGQTLLYAAVDAQSVSAVAILLKHGASITDFNDGYNTLELALYKGMSGVAIEAVKAGADPDRPAPELSAVDVGQLMLDHAFLQYLSKKNPTPDAATTKMYRLALALQSRKPANFDLSPWDAALTARTRAFQLKSGLAPHGHPSKAMSRALEPYLRAALFAAARADDVDAVERLISVNRGLMSMRDQAGMDALMEASVSLSAGVVKTLLGEHASVSTVDAHGDTALVLAALPRKSSKLLTQISIVKALIAAGADINASNADKLSAKRLGQANYTLASAMGIDYTQTPSRLYVAVMARGSSFLETSYGWNCNASFPRDWLKSKWDAGALLISASMVEDRWCLVMGENVLGNAAQGYTFVEDNRALIAEVRSDARKDQTLSEFVFNQGNSVAVFTASGGVRDGYRLISISDLPSLLNDTIWKQGFDVTRIEPASNDQWLVIFGQSMGYGAQTVVRGSFEHVVAGIRAAWKEGKAVTSLAHSGPMWVGVLSEGANEKDQSFVIAQSMDELKADIDTKWKSGWHLSILTGGSFADASSN